VSARRDLQTRGLSAAALARQAARAAGLHYTSDQAPGLRRARAGKRFLYRDETGRRVTDPATLERIKSLAIPPAWRDVWICPQDDGHLQATGRDDRGRKQFRYHPRWRTVRDAGKFDRTLAFARALPRIRLRVARDFSQPGLGRTRVLAAMIRLLEATHVRIGNEEYRRQNRSIGLSTMQDRHARVRGSRLRFVFRGKSGRLHDVELHAPRLARIVRRLQHLPGQELFQYLDAEGRAHTISSHDVNAYLHEIAGEEFSAKDFRTWAGTVHAAVELARRPACRSEGDAKRVVADVIRTVAGRLGNTPAICRRCYVHPAVTTAFLSGAQLRMNGPVPVPDGPRMLQWIEGRVLRFLRRHARAEPSS